MSTPTSTTQTDGLAGRDSGTGGPAFPTLRDFFAAAALTGILSAGYGRYDPTQMPELIAFNMADAMLRQRQSPPPATAGE